MTSTYISFRALRRLGAVWIHWPLTSLPARLTALKAAHRQGCYIPSSPSQPFSVDLFLRSVSITQCSNVRILFILPSPSGFSSMCATSPYFSFYLRSVTFYVCKNGLKPYVSGSFGKVFYTFPPLLTASALTYPELRRGPLRHAEYKGLE